MKYLLTTILLCFALGASHADAAGDAVLINLEVAFCNHDLVCDLEENYAACPSDCAAPATSTPPESPVEEDEAPSSPSGTRAPLIERIVEIFSPFVPFLPTTVGVADESENCSGESCTRSVSRALDRSVRSSQRVGSGEKSVNISTQEDDNGVVFLWNRGDPVRILRSDESFPKNPFEGGTLVYEGSTGFFEDSLNSIAQNLYYAFFVKGEDGTYSNPQLVLVKNSLLASPAAFGGTSNTSAFGFAVLGTLITILIVRIIWFLL